MSRARSTQESAAPERHTPDQAEREEARSLGPAASGVGFAPPALPANGAAFQRARLRRLQRSAGNGAVQRALGAAAPAALQRDGEAAAAEPPTREFFNYDGVERARANSMSLFLRTQLLVQGGGRAVQGSRDKMLAVNDVYGQAFARFEGVLARARQEARDNERYYNIAVGVAAGVLASVLVSVGAALVLPAAVVEAGAFSGTWWALQAGSAGASAVAGTAAGDAAAQSGLTSEAGHDVMAPAGLRPEAMQLPAWRAITDLQSTLLTYSGATTNLFLMHGAAEHALGEIRAHVSGGETELDERDLLDICMSLVASNQALRTYEANLEAAMRHFARLSSAVEAAPARADVDELERNIWIMWMASLSDSQSDILDLDEIEDHLARIGLLGSGGQLGVDFGLYTSEEDEREALAAARRLNGGLSARYSTAPGT